MQYTYKEIARYLPYVWS